MGSVGAGYDLWCNIFSPDGRVFQVEYASKAVENSGAVVGLQCSDGVVMGVEKLLLSKLLVEGSNRRVHTVDRKAGIAVAGYLADGRAIANQLRDTAAQYRDYYGVDIPPHVLSERLGQFMHVYTCYGGYRPFGVSVLLAAYDEEDKAAYLYMVDPAGVSYRYRGCAVGKARQATRTMVEKLDGSSLTCREALKELAKNLHTTHDDVKDKPFEFEASWICEETGFKHELVPKELREAASKWAKDKIEEEDMSEDDSDDDDDDE